MDIRLIGDDIFYDRKQVAKLISAGSCETENFRDWISDAGDIDMDEVRILEEKYFELAENKKDFVRELKELIGDYGD